MTLWQKLDALNRQNVAHALVTITQVTGSTPREPGAKMIVLADGTFFDTIGGGQLETLVIADAITCLRRRQAGTFRYPLAAKAGQCCGGSVEVFIEALGARPELLLFGAGHVAQAVARVLQGTPFLVRVIDERQEWLSQLDASVVQHPLPWDAALQELTFDPARTFAAVMTHRHDHDQDIIEALVRKPFAYVGLIGSRAKWKRFSERLSRRGITADELARVRCPLGVPTGGKAPQEVAISLAAELLQRHYGKTQRTRAVLLAGGRSERMGQAKGLVAIDGKPLLLSQVEALTALDVDVVVVTGEHHDTYAALLDGHDVDVVRNPAPERGPFSSLQEGLRGHAGPAFVLPLDVRAPRVDVWNALAATHAAAAVPVFEGRGGHPVYLSAALVAHCLTLPAESSRLDVVLAQTPDTARVAVDDRRVTDNLNTPEDVRASLNAER